MNTYELPISAIAAHLLIAPKSDVRFYLNGVYFDPAGRMVSTDGSVMLVTKHDALKMPDALPCIVPRDALVAAVKMAGKKAATLFVDIEPGEPARVTLRAMTGASMTCTGIDGRYPDYLRVIPATVDGVAGTYDPTRYSRVGDALQILGGLKTTQEVRLYQNNVDKAAWMMLDNSVGAIPHVAVIMPLRAHNAMSVEDAGKAVARVVG